MSCWSKCIHHNHYISFILDVAFWVVEWVWSIHIHKPYRITTTPLRKSCNAVHNGGYRSFCRSCQVNYLKQVKKDSDLFNTVTQCAPVGKTGFIESYSHIGRTSWQVFVCSGGEVECMLAASIHNIKSIHCSHPVPLGAWTWKRGCQAMHLTENASPSQRNVKIRCPLPWRSAATWFDMLSYSWCSVFCLTPLANQISC